LSQWGILVIILMVMRILTLPFPWQRCPPQSCQPINWVMGLGTASSLHIPANKSNTLKDEFAPVRPTPNNEDGQFRWPTINTNIKPTTPPPAATPATTTNGVTTGVGRRPRSGSAGRSGGGNRFTIMNAHRTKIPDDRAPAKNKNWLTAEEEKAQLFEKARQRVEMTQGAHAAPVSRYSIYGNVISFTDIYASQPPASASHLLHPRHDLPGLQRHRPPILPIGFQLKMKNHCTKKLQMQYKWRKEFCRLCSTLIPLRVCPVAALLSRFQQQHSCMRKLSLLKTIRQMPCKSSGGIYIYMRGMELATRTNSIHTQFFFPHFSLRTQGDWQRVYA